ncbi:MAG TPA: SMP-30/gluconolactonase/LRE family protein, partial [Rhodopila sp.]|nr:SMP-30/gluconolactonase/LRE family protein [Rhodopila sp.]
MGAFTNIKRDLEQIIFRNREQNAIPAMDGAISPNNRLDALPSIGEPIPGADDAAEGPDGALYVSGGRIVYRLAGDGYTNRTVFATFEANVGGLGVHPDGRVLVCVSGRGLAAVDAHGRQTWLRQAEDQPLRCLTGVAAAADGTIFLTDGTTAYEPDDWCRDLMAKNHLGRLLTCRPDLDSPNVLLRDLYYPNGLSITPDGAGLWFTESWKHRVSRTAINGSVLGRPTVVLNNLAGYPARIAPASGGGFWLAMFAVRTHLVEFVLREDEYREAMIRTIPPSRWVAPALATTNHCHEPMQFGSIKALG